jgi:hypothetical protein
MDENNNKICFVWKNEKTSKIYFQQIHFTKLIQTIEAI